MAHYDCNRCGRTPGASSDPCSSCLDYDPNTMKRRVEPGEVAPVKSDGGSSSYYQLTIKNKAGESFQCETGDIIRALVANDFNLGNIVKACRRVSESLNGRGKAGTSPEYDLNKIIYFAKDLKDHVI